MYSQFLDYNGKSFRARLPAQFLPERDMPDLSGKIALVTGGNTGIGYETTKQLLLKNAKVYLAARSPEKAAAAIKRLQEETHKSAIFLQLDLADLPSVRRAQMRSWRKSRGSICFSIMEFGTNAIGHFFFTELLLPALTKSHEETNAPARVIHTSSIGHQLAPGNGIEFTTLKGGPERDAWLKNAGSFMGPWHGSNLLQAAGNVFFFPAPMGAYTQLWGGTVASPAEINGQYLIPWGKIGKADVRASNRELEDEVIAYIREQIKGF
ncbi:NAD-P-binding protein [Mycena leptocephala]|nr:NAD-P-binding protein [Mycena leptocephala]